MSTEILTLDLAKFAVPCRDVSRIPAFDTTTTEYEDEQSHPCWMPLDHSPSLNEATHV